MSIDVCVLADRDFCNITTKYYVYLNQLKRQSNEMILLIQLGFQFNLKTKREKNYYATFYT
jgi:hypothetical protein